MTKYKILGGHLRKINSSKRNSIKKNIVLIKSHDGIILKHRPTKLYLAIYY